MLLSVRDAAGCCPLRLHDSERHTAVYIRKATDPRAPGDVRRDSGVRALSGIRPLPPQHEREPDRADSGGGNWGETLPARQPADGRKRGVLLPMISGTGDRSTSSARKREVQHLGRGRGRRRHEWLHNNDKQCSRQSVLARAGRPTRRNDHDRTPLRRWAERQRVLPGASEPDLEAAE